jgi:hypothetical protein
MSENASNFNDISRERFGSLNVSEKKLMDSFSRGKSVVYSSNDPELRGDFLAWLCTNTRENFLIDHKGIRIIGARIKGQIDLEDAILRFPLVLKNCVIRDGIVLRNATAPKLNFMGSHTGAIDATELRTESSLMLCDGFHAQGEVKLLNAWIGGDLDCRGGKFENCYGKTAIDGDRLNVHGRIRMYKFGEKRFHAIGEVKLTAAEIGWALISTDAIFDNRNHNAICAAGIETKNGSIYLGRCKIIGSVNFNKARIRYDFYCSNSLLERPDGRVLALEGSVVDGSVFLCRGLQILGELTLKQANIGGSLVCSGARLSNPTGDALNAQDASLRGGIILSGMGKKPEGNLNLRQTKARYFEYDDKAWPEKGSVDLEGFEYENLSAGEQCLSHDDMKKQRSVASYLKWLQLQIPNRFCPQPYEHLAMVLRKSGRDADAKKILIAKAKDRAKHMQLSFLERFRYQMLGLTICYGYRPWRTFWIGLIVVVLGWILFAGGFRAQAITPTKEWLSVSNGSGIENHISQDYPKFNALVFSLDSFLPLVDLHQVSYWLPKANRTGELQISQNYALPVSGNLLCIFMWFEIIAGWILTTLLVVGLTGLVRN